MAFFNWVIIFFILTQNITTRQRFIIFILLFFVASFKLSLYGGRTFAMRGFAFADWGLAGPRGFFQNPGELAVQMVVFAPVALFFTLGIKSYLKKWQFLLLHLMPVTAVLTILGTNSRGSQLALAGQIVALLLTSKRKIKMLIVIGIISIIGFNILPEEQKARFVESGEDETSIQRFLYWKHGWKMIKDHPFLGVGYYNFMAYYSRYHSDDLILPNLVMAQLPHNIFIQVGTDTGFSGIFVFLALIVGSFTNMYKLGREAEITGDFFVSSLTKGMNLSLLGYIIAGQFVTIAYYPYFWIHLVFVSAMCTFWNSERRSLKIKGFI
jgi:O-antigen ligase